MKRVVLDRGTLYELTADGGLLPLRSPHTERLRRWLPRVMLASAVVLGVSLSVAYLAWRQLDTQRAEQAQAEALAAQPPARANTAAPPLQAPRPRADEPDARTVVAQWMRAAAALDVQWLDLQLRQTAPPAQGLPLVP